MGPISSCLEWYSSGKKNALLSTCSTRDVFQARLDGFFNELSATSIPSEDAALMTAICGEVGNNSFDHNLGQWSDQTGCLFQFFTHENTFYVCLADRGKGFLWSLRHVDPSIQTDQQAIEIAFEKRISGRAPEKRGNGLKFVRAIINGHSDRGLLCRSGTGEIFLGAMKPAEKLVTTHRNGAGVFTLLLWKCS